MDQHDGMNSSLNNKQNQEDNNNHETIIMKSTEDPHQEKNETINLGRIARLENAISQLIHCKIVGE